MRSIPVPRKRVLRILFPLPPLYKGRWIAVGKTKGSACPCGADRYGPPALLRSARSLYKGKDKIVSRVLNSILFIGKASLGSATCPRVLYK